MKRSILGITIVVTIFSMLLISCGPQTPTGPAATDTPAPQNTEVSMETSTPAPASAEGLVTVKDGKPAPALAASWTVSEDGLNYIFNLRTDAKFDDGTPVNADAVAANFNRWFDPNDPAHGSGSYDAWVAAFGGFKGEKDADGKPKSSFDGIEKVDVFTVLVHLNRPYDGLLATLAQPDFGIVNPATFAK